MLVSLTVGKVDAGVTVLLTPDKRLIEFPSILLPPNITSGSIVDITVSRNHRAEGTARANFISLQAQIEKAFGSAEPEAPTLRCRNATQTSVVLEWDPIQLATADLLSLALYRDGQKAGAIPRPLAMHTTKISGLGVDTEYKFHLVLRTTAGTYASPPLTVRTHKMTNLSGITISTGVLPAATRDALTAAVDRIGAKLIDSVRIDTTHFVTTEGKGIAWEKAVDMNIPVVRPEWVDACEKAGRILGVTKFYLDAARGAGNDFDYSTIAADAHMAASDHGRKGSAASVAAAHASHSSRDIRIGTGAAVGDESEEKDKASNERVFSIRPVKLDRDDLRPVAKESPAVDASAADRSTTTGDKAHEADADGYDRANNPQSAQSRKLSQDHSQSHADKALPPDPRLSDNVTDTAADTAAANHNYHEHADGKNHTASQQSTADADDKTQSKTVATDLNDRAAAGAGAGDDQISSGDHDDDEKEQEKQPTDEEKRPVKDREKDAAGEDDGSSVGGGGFDDVAL